MLRRLADELHLLEATPERDALLIQVRDRIAELCGATYESGAWRERPVELTVEGGRARIIPFYG